MKKDKEIKKYISIGLAVLTLINCSVTSYAQNGLGEQIEIYSIEEKEDQTKDIVIESDSTDEVIIDDLYERNSFDGKECSRIVDNYQMNVVLS